jgi:hypothetical protein
VQGRAPWNMTLAMFGLHGSRIALRASGMTASMFRVIGT